MSDYPQELIPVEYQDSNRYRILPNGAVFDNTKAGKGPIVAKLPSKSDITKDNSQDFHTKRALSRAKAEQAFRSGMAKSGPGKGSLATWAAIAQVQSDLAQDAERGLSSTRAAEFVGKASGFLSRDGENGSPGGVTLQISPDIARLLVDKLVSGQRSGDQDDE